MRIPFHFIDQVWDLRGSRVHPVQCLAPAWQRQHWSHPTPPPPPPAHQVEMVVWCLTFPAPFLIWILGMLFPWSVGNTVWLPGICQQLPSLPCWLSQASCVLGGGWAPHFFWMLVRTLLPSQLSGPEWNECLMCREGYLRGFIYERCVARLLLWPPDLWSHTSHAW